MDHSRVSEIPFPCDQPAVVQHIYRSPIAHDILYALSERPRDAAWVTGLKNGDDALLALLIYERQVDRMLERWSGLECGPLDLETLEWLQRMGMRPD